jgi:hypothetical protein
LTKGAGKSRLFSDWRDFGREYAIIVLGVLTALFAQQAVESLNWRGKVRAALADMDNELSIGDGPQAHVRVAISQCVTSRLDAIREAVERGDRSQSRKLIDGLWLPRRTYDYLAREAATASDISSHIPADRMLQYRIAYEVVPNMNRLAEKELSDFAHLNALPRSGGSLETAEKLATIDAIEALRADNDEMTREARFLLNHISAIGLGLDRASVQRNFGGATSQYSSCIGPITRS